MSLIVGDTNTTFTSKYVVCKEINVARMMIFHPENMSQSDIIHRINIKHENTNIIYLTICLSLPIFGKNDEWGWIDESIYVIYKKKRKKLPARGIELCLIAE